MTISLTPDTITILQAMQANDEIPARTLASKLEMDYIMVMAGVNELKEHGLGDFTEEEIVEYQLTEEGQDYAKNLLPESRLFKFIVQNEMRQVSLNELRDKAEKELSLKDKMFFISVNHMRKAMWVSQTNIDGIPTLVVLKQEFEEKEEQALLELINDSGVINKEDIPGNLQEYIEVLKKRTLITEKKYTRRLLKLTREGKAIKEKDISSVKEVTRLTREHIKTGDWRNVSFKAYDVGKPGPAIAPGRINPLVEIINKVREIFYSMGFMEIRGPIVESAFFNFDALFQPQDHPAREMHDTFYLEKPGSARLPGKKYVKRVSEVHENGGNTGSTGWGYTWDKKVAQQTVLRTHTTATTVRQLGKAIQQGVPLPLKVFSVDRVYRNEKVDRSHLAEFMQVEGIIIGDNVNLGDLRGTLVEFYKKMGFDRIITRPGFFPYTEPSMEISVYSEELESWMEIGGSGIFRPEVCEPWGIKEPTRVLAWGQGLERIAMLRLKRKDIRDLYKNPLSWLRRAPYPKL